MPMRPSGIGTGRTGRVAAPEEGRASCHNPGSGPGPAIPPRGQPARADRGRLRRGSPDAQRQQPTPRRSAWLMRGNLLPDRSGCLSSGTRTQGGSGSRPDHRRTITTGPRPVSAGGAVPCPATVVPAALAARRSIASPRPSRPNRVRGRPEPPAPLMPQRIRCRLVEAGADQPVLGRGPAGPPRCVRIGSAGRTGSVGPRGVGSHLPWPYCLPSHSRATIRGRPRPPLRRLGRHHGPGQGVRDGVRAGPEDAGWIGAAGHGIDGTAAIAPGTMSAASTGLPCARRFERQTPTTRPKSYPRRDRPSRATVS